MDLAESLPEIDLDPGRIEQVIENFVNNAIKFSFPGTRATVRTVSNEDGAVQFEVNDGGPGLKEEDMDKLFMKYARLSNKPTGGEVSTGLGLAICKRLVDLHGGEIGARNREPVGATFWFTFPSRQEADGGGEDRK